MTVGRPRRRLTVMSAQISALETTVRAGEPAEELEECRHAFPRAWRHDLRRRW